MTSPILLSLEDRLAITDVVHRFFWLVDHGRAAEAGALFTADAKLIMGPGSPSPGTVEGPAIAAMFTARQTQTHVTTRHVISNISLAAHADGTVASSCILTFYRSDDETRDTRVTIVADIDETYVRVDGGWRIASRTVTPIFKRV
jgi:uncharacterized protein (TIGR02246 family)